MSIYINRLPINFGDQGILLYELGYEPTKVSVTSATQDSFEHQGIWCAIAPAHPLTNHKIRRCDPIEIPQQIIPYLRDGLCALLATIGEVEKVNSSLHYIDPSGAEYDLLVELDVASKTYHLVIAYDNLSSDDYPQYQRFIARIAGRFLPDTQAKIGINIPTKSTLLSLPDLIFDPNGTQHSTSARDGLFHFGPFDRKQFGSRSLHILVIGREKQEGRLSSMIHDLSHGISSPNEVKQLWGRPWQKTFYFQSLDFTPLIIAAYSLQDSRTKLQRAIEDAQARGCPFDLVIYEADQNAINLERFLLSLGLPFHLLLPSELQREGIDRANLLLDLALTLYVKAGGKPWLLPIKQTMEHQLIIGIGTEVWADGLLGFATIFSSHGNYRVGEAKWNASEADWSTVLADFITNQLLRLGVADGWSNGAQLKITFHIDQRWSAEQTTLLKNLLLERLGPQYSLQVIFLYLAYTHHYRLWQLDATQGPALEKVLPSQMGTVLEIDTTKYLVQMCEPQSFSQHWKPMLVECLPASDPHDLGFQVAQIFHFASLSWRSVRRAPLPVTLEYGKLIAGKGKLLRSSDPHAMIPEKLLSIPWYI